MVRETQVPVMMGVEALILIPFHGKPTMLAQTFSLRQELIMSGM